MATMAQRTREAMAAGHEKYEDARKWIFDTYGETLTQGAFYTAKSALKNGTKKDETEVKSFGEAFKAKETKKAKQRKKMTPKKVTVPLTAEERKPSPRTAVMWDETGTVKEINFCPHCGANLIALKNALQVGQMAEEARRGS